MMNKKRTKSLIGSVALAGIMAFEIMLTPTVSLATDEVNPDSDMVIGTTDETKVTDTEIPEEMSDENDIIDPGYDNVHDEELKLDGTPVSGSLTKQASDSYFIETTAAGWIEITAQCLGNYPQTDDGQGSFTAAICYSVNSEKKRETADVVAYTTSPQSQTITALLEPGKYTVEVYTPSYKTASYKLTASFEPAGNNETESNNFFDDAQEIHMGDNVDGLLSMNDKLDYYTFTVDKQTDIKMDFVIRYSCFRMQLFNEDYECIGYIQNSQVKGSEKEPCTDKYEKSIPAGKYYICIDHTYGDEYTDLLEGRYKFKLTTERGDDDFDDSDHDPYETVAPCLSEYGELDGIWIGSAKLKSGKILDLGMRYTRTTGYDGRKHIVKGTKKSSISINPDIECSGLVVMLNGKKLDGIITKGYTYKNNQNPSTYGYYGFADYEFGPWYSDDYVYAGTNMMQIIPVLKYDSNDAGLKKILKEEKDLKKTINSLISPKLKKIAPQNGSSWILKGYSSKPILVDIEPISLEDVSLYTQAQVNNDPELKNGGGFLVYNGKNSIKFKNMKIDGLTIAVPVSGDMGSLSYQIAYKLDDGSVKNKKLKLRAGKWSYKINTNEDGEKEPYHYCNNEYDYIIDPELAPGDDIRFIVHQDQGADIYETFKRGFFAGSFPENE